MFLLLCVRIVGKYVRFSSMKLVSVIEFVCNCILFFMFGRFNYEFKEKNNEK